ncbi:MAG: hypothetical protein HYT75_07395, partial [Deltaproteobacteria bacterium]|nr:hypothetical protein [Deltaproteobacteria bacterium]
MGTLSSIDLGPLKEVVAYPQLRKLVDLNDIDVDGLFKMDKDLDGHLQRSEYPSDKDAEFILVKERVENVGRELEARKQGLFSPDATSLKNCNAVLKEIEQTKSLPPANVIFFCRGEMLLLASKTVAILELSSDKRADAIISAMQENLPQAIKFIKYAPEAERFRLYSLAYSYEMDKRGSAENGLIGKCRILDESKNITDENLRSAMYWMGMKDDDPSVILHALQILATPEVVAIGLENDSPHVMNEAIELIPEMPVEKQGGFVDIVLKKFIKHSADISSLNEDYFISYFMGGFLRMIPRIKD